MDVFPFPKSMIIGYLLGNAVLNFYIKYLNFG